MSHPGTEETLLDEGESASGPWWRFGFWFWFLFGGFCLVLGLLVFFSPHHDCVMRGMALETLGKSMRT